MDCPSIPRDPRASGTRSKDAAATPDPVCVARPRLRGATSVAHAVEWTSGLLVVLLFERVFGDVLVTVQWGVLRLDLVGDDFRYSAIRGA